MTHWSVTIEHSSYNIWYKLPTYAHSSDIKHAGGDVAHDDQVKLVSLGTRMIENF